MGKGRPVSFAAWAAGVKGGTTMSRTFHHGERRIRVRGIRRDPADLRRLARALTALAQAQAESDAEAADEQREAGETTDLSEIEEVGHNEKSKGDAA